MQGLYFKFREGELGKIGLSGKHRCAERSTAIGRYSGVMIKVQFLNFNIEKSDFLYLFIVQNSA